MLKSEMGLLRRRRNWTNLKLCQSFGSNSNGKERGLALCGLVPGCCDNGLKERQLRRGEREREREIIFFEFMLYETVGGCEIFLRAK